MLSKPSPDYNVAWHLGQYLSFVSLINTSLPGDMVPLFFALFCIFWLLFLMLLFFKNIFASSGLLLFSHSTFFFSLIYGCVGSSFLCEGFL